MQTWAQRAQRAEQRVAELERLLSERGAVVRPCDDIDAPWSCNCAGEIFVESASPGAKDGQLRIGHFQGDQRTAQHVCALHNASLSK